MDRKFKIFYITPEVAPFVGSNDIADISSALTKSLKENGHEIRVMMPNYKAVNPRKYILRDVIRLKDLTVKLGDKEILFNAKSAFLPNSKVQIYFVDQKDYYGRKGLYADPKSGKPFKDNAERFAVFCMGCLETLRMLHWQPDIIHCSDWQTALIPIYLKTILKDDPFFQNIKIVFSILDYASLDQSFAPDNVGLKDVDRFESISDDNKVHLHHAGIALSDKVFTRDGTFQQALNAESSAHQRKTLDAIEQYSGKITPLTNAEDAFLWHPASDTHISVKYDQESFSKKEENKKALLQKAGMEYKEGAPLIGVAAAPTTEKSAEILLHFLQEAISRGARIIISTPEKAREHLAGIAEIASENPNHLSFQEETDDSFEHLIAAGVDLYLIPCYEDSVRASQFYTFRYGTVPIVKANAGFNDFIQDFHKSPDSGAGFLFLKEDKNDLAKALDKALNTYEDSEKWRSITKNVMGLGHLWHAVTPDYVRSISQIVD